MKKLLFIVCAAFALVAFIPTVQAGGCLQNSALNGTCTKGTTCPSGSVSSNDLVSATQLANSSDIEFFAGGCQQDEICCVKSGTDVCQKVAAKAAQGTTITKNIQDLSKCMSDYFSTQGMDIKMASDDLKLQAKMICEQSAGGTKAPDISAYKCMPSANCEGNTVTGNFCPQGFFCCNKEKVAPEAKTAQLGSSTKLEDPLDGATIFTLIQRIVNVILGVVGALALLVFIYAGITWMTAGSSNRVQEAKDAMKYAVIGLSLIALAYVITTNFIKILTSG